MLHAGQEPDRLFVVLEGELEIQATESQPAVRLGPGQPLWENAWILHQPPERSIYAVTDGLLLCLRPSDVTERSRNDRSFGQRWLHMLRTYALEHVASAAPEPSAPAQDGSARQRFIPEMIERLLDGDF